MSTDRMRDDSVRDDSVRDDKNERREMNVNPFGYGYMPGGMGPQVEEFTAHAGEKLPEGTGIASQETMIDAMKTVFDPEIPVNIYDLGLIYKCEIAADGTVSADMSLTAPGCPVAECG